MLISELAQRFIEKERPIGCFLAPETVLEQIVSAVRLYNGYATLDALAADPFAIPPLPPIPPIIDGTLDLTDSEWVLIGPIAMLYVEREEARQAEMSRGMGLDPFGRTVAEVQQDIQQSASALPLQAFFQPIVTIGP